MARSRVHEFVLYGATGFTGGLVAEYLARNASLDRTPWAIAGRNRDKLHEVRARLARIRPGYESLPILVASSDDRASLAAMAKNTRLVVSTVGPFERHGEPLFQACAEQGTDYIDSSGEPTFVRRMVAKFDAKARERGALMVSACGLDCVPTDLGCYYTMRELAPSGPVEMEGLFAFRARPSGGTWASLLSVFEQPGELLRSPPPFAASEGRSVALLPARMRHERELGWLAPLQSLDPEMALRSAGELSLYGPSFRYAHYLVLGSSGRAFAYGAGVAGIVALAQTRPTRALLGKLVQPGSGPSEEERARSWFRLRFRAKHQGSLLVTEVSGGDPGYDETAKMLGECALSMVQDRARLPASSGVRTPAVAFGDILLARLIKAGLSFRVVNR